MARHLINVLRDNVPGRAVPVACDVASHALTMHLCPWMIAFTTFVVLAVSNLPPSTRQQICSRALDVLVLACCIAARVF